MKLQRCRTEGKDRHKAQKRQAPGRLSPQPKGKTHKEDTAKPRPHNKETAKPSPLETAQPAAAPQLQALGAGGSVRSDKIRSPGSPPFPDLDGPGNRQRLCIAGTVSGGPNPVPGTRRVWPPGSGQGLWLREPPQECDVSI